MTPPIPVTVLSGFLGAGKTTVLTRLLAAAADRRLAVLVNDMSAVNIDEELVRETGVSVAHVAPEMVALSNGCICCTLREDLLREVARLARAGAFEAIVIESSGISEPLPVAETFTFDVDGAALMDVARLDTMVTVVDAAQFFELYRSTDSLSDRMAAVSAADHRRLVPLLVDQIEFADVILLTKTDLAAPGDVARVRAVVGALNRGARILECVHGQVPLAEILDTGRFSLERARAHAGWLRELRGEHRPETEEYGISSFVYSANRPFDHDRLVDLMRHGRLKGVLRSKGFAWSTGDPDRALAWSQAGAIFSLNAVRTWKRRADGTPAGGQRLVFIGMHMDEARLRRRLDAVLVPDVPAAAEAAVATATP